MAGNALQNTRSKGIGLTRRGTAHCPDGFSLTELAVAITISLILAGIAIPEAMNAIHMSHVRGAADSLSVLIQQARMTAEQHDTTVPLYVTTVGTDSAQGAFISCSASACPDAATWQSGDAYVPYGADVSNSDGTGAPAELNPGFVPEASGTVLYLTPLGRAYKSSGVSFTMSKGFVYYVSDDHNDWAAVSVSPLGRSKVWVYTGGWH